MATRFEFQKSYEKDLEKIMELYLTKSRAVPAVKILERIYKLYAKDNKFVRQYMLVRSLEKIPKSTIQEILTDLLRIRAIRNQGAKRTVSLYQPTLDQLGKRLKGHGQDLKRIHEDLLKKEEK